jgi:hypothetical protein
MQNIAGEVEKKESGRLRWYEGGGDGQPPGQLDLGVSIPAAGAFQNEAEAWTGTVRPRNIEQLIAQFNLGRLYEEGTDSAGTTRKSVKWNERPGQGTASASNAWQLVQKPGNALGLTSRFYVVQPGTKFRYTSIAGEAAARGTISRG